MAGLNNVIFSENFASPAKFSGSLYKIFPKTRQLMRHIKMLSNLMQIKNLIFKSACSLSFLQISLVNIAEIINIIPLPASAKHRPKKIK